MVSIVICAVISLIFVSCGQDPKTTNGVTNGVAYGIDVNGDTLIINSATNSSQTLSYSISGKPFATKSFTKSIELDMLELIKENKEHLNEFAYTIATTGNLPIRFTIGNQLDTTLMVPIQVSSAFTEKETKIISGPCLKLGLKEVSNSQKVNIKKWLFNRGTHADDATIHKMAQVVNFLTSSAYDEYIPEEGKEIPVLSSFQDAKYKITTDIQSDYYYLFAATDYSEINDFIAEIVVQNFQYAEKNISASFSCFRPIDRGGILTIFLIAINNDWSRTIVPVGIVAIDNVKPRIISDNEITSPFLNSLSQSAPEERIPHTFGAGITNARDIMAQTYGENYGDEALRSGWGESRFDRGDFSPEADIENRRAHEQLLFDKKEVSQNKYIKELNLMVKFPEDTPIISGDVLITTGQFRGDNAQFTISFSGDVEVMTIKREIHRSYSWLKPGTKTINFSGQTSPIHFTYELDLGIGDNYIPITVKDKRGNVSTYSYHIEMVQVEKTNPEINIDNNIDIWN